MKRFGSCFLLFCFFAVLLSPMASANSAPRDYRVAVKVVNGPEDVYYLDLLEEIVRKRRGKGPEGLDQELADMMRQAVPKGWQACTLVQSDPERYVGDLEGENGVHIFHGWDTPRVFRILIVTKSGESWISEPMERQVLNSSVKVDWEAKTARITPKWVSVGMQFLSTFIPALLIEGLVLIAFRLASKRNWLVFLVVNLVTQGALSAIMANGLAQGGFGAMPYFLILFIPAELLIAVAEANIYENWFRTQVPTRALWYGFTANAASYALGWAAVNLL